MEIKRLQSLCRAVYGFTLTPSSELPSRGANLAARLRLQSSCCQSLSAVESKVVAGLLISTIRCEQVVFLQALRTVDQSYPQRRGHQAARTVLRHVFSLMDLLYVFCHGGVRACVRRTAEDGEKDTETGVNVYALKCLH